jgi:hypothetical protein
MKLYPSFAIFYFFIISNITNKTVGEMVLTQYGGDDFGSSGDYGSSVDYGAGDASYEHSTDDASSTASDPTDSYNSESKTSSKDASTTDDYSASKLGTSDVHSNSGFKIPKQAQKFIKDVAKGIIKGVLKPDSKPKSVSKPKASPKFRLPIAPKKKQKPISKK